MRVEGQADDSLESALSSAPKDYKTLKNLLLQQLEPESSQDENSQSQKKDLAAELKYFVIQQGGASIIEKLHGKIH